MQLLGVVITVWMSNLRTPKPVCACVSRHLEAEDVVAPDDALVAGPRPVHGHVSHLHTALYTRASNEGSRS